MIPQLQRSMAGISILVATAVLVGCSNSTAPAATPPPPVPVSVMEVKTQTIPISLEAVGQAEGARQIEVRARVGGILAKRLYQEGAPVKAGQPLFEIDRVPYETALAQAKGSLAERAARTTLDALDRNQLYVLPQFDARMIWRMKRWIPASYARGLGVMSRLAAKRA